MSQKSLKGKVAVITGASKGLGKAMALALAEGGARLALVSRNEKQLNAVAEEAQAVGGQAKVFVADVTQEDQVSKIERDVVEQRHEYEPDERVPDVPLVCAAHEGTRLWPHHQYDLDYELGLAAGASCVLVQQDGLAWIDAGFGARARW